MGRIDKRNITLSPEQASLVDDVVAAGEFGSPSEVVGEALREWMERRENHGYTLAELRRLVQEGIDSGPSRFASIDEIKAEARRRFERANSAA
jgi:antitoxin ParD1/3/4